MAIVVVAGLVTAPAVRAVEWEHLTASEQAAMDEAVVVWIAHRSGVRKMAEGCEGGKQWLAASNVGETDRGAAYRALTKLLSREVGRSYDASRYEKIWMAAREQEIGCARATWDELLEGIESSAADITYLVAEGALRKARGGVVAFDQATALTRLREIARTDRIDLINAAVDDAGGLRWGMRRRFAAVEVANCTLVFRGAHVVEKRGVEKVADHFGVDLRRIEGLMAVRDEVHLRGAWFEPDEEARFVFESPGSRVDFVLAVEALRAGCPVATAGMPPRD